MSNSFLFVSLQPILKSQRQNGLKMALSHKEMEILLFVILLLFATGITTIRAGGVFLV
jgi:hypothetical protein